MVGKSSKWRCLCSWGDHTDMSFPASHGWLPDGSPIRLLSFAMGQKLSVLHVIHIKLARIYGCKSMRAASWKKRWAFTCSEFLCGLAKDVVPKPNGFASICKIKLAIMCVYPIVRDTHVSRFYILVFSPGWYSQDFRSPCFAPSKFALLRKKHVLW